jgi:hypothetical protein
MGLFGKAKSVLVVDTAAVLKTKGVRGRAAPRQQLQLLRALSRFVQRENLAVTAVLVGSPLDKAPHNQVVEGVRVRYTAAEEGLTSELSKALRQAGSGGILVTDDAALETRVLRGGGTLLRVSTFRKLLDDGNEPNEAGERGGERNSNPNLRPIRNHNNNRRERDRGPRPAPSRNGNAPQPAAVMDEGDAEEPSRAGNDAISQMIDLVE